MNIEQTKRSKNKDNSDDEDDQGYSEEITSLDKLNPANTNSMPINGLKKPNGYKPQNGSVLISRDDKLVLVPEPPTNQNTEKLPNCTKVSEDFDLSNIFEYIKVGVEAIIEDQVTSRFDSEELKNWNLLTRTNTGYEFLSWKLTVIWMCGFFMRYFFLFPLRVLICFFGVSSTCYF